MRLNANSPDVLAVRGLVLFLGGKLPQALQHLASALRLDPGHEIARRLRVRVKDVERLKEEGNVAFKSGILPEAVDNYTQALDVCSSSSTLYHSLTLYHLGCWRLGRRGKRRADPCHTFIKPCYDLSQGISRSP
jgi:tetratricopeptide (TPR) repeat protein